MLKRIAGSLTANAVVTTSLAGAVVRSRLTRAVTSGVDPSPPADTNRKQSGCSDSPGPALTGMTMRNGDPSADCATASPSTRPWAAEDASSVASSSAVMAAARNRNGAGINTAVLGRSLDSVARMILNRLKSGPWPATVK
jgi:hypothetical protein